MSQLLELPIDELKVDKSFVIALGGDRRARAIVSSAVELARALHLTLVAEGIETAANLKMLEDIGADIGQGFFIARPLTPAQLDDFLASSHLEGDVTTAVPVTVGQ
jgi:EAL domain-containing protein (putative c-di-GMP-specific phosphodiesterase class I)